MRALAPASRCVLGRSCSSSRSPSRSRSSRSRSSRSSSACPPRDAARTSSAPGRHGRAHRHPEDERVVAQALILALRDAGRLPPRAPPLPRARARRHARRAAARAAARRRRDRAARRVRPASACSARRSRRSGSTSAFTQTAVVLAVAYVASPFYLRQAIAAFEARRREPPRRVAHARRRARRARSCASRSRSRAAGSRRRGALVRARHRRVRRDDHVRRQPPGAYADALARDLLRVRPSTSTPRSRSVRCSSSSASPSCSPPKLVPRYGSTLGVDFAVPLRAFDARAEPRGRAARRSRSSGPRARGRRRCCARSRGWCGPRAGGSRSATTSWLRRRDEASSARPTSGASGSCSRTTRSSRT